jgi:broad specificity phosphatase PhoE
MSTLLLIRHGENDFLVKNKLPGRLAGIHLNEHGREQAVILSETLKTLPIKAIYASPLERAVETAEPLAHLLGLDIQLQTGLMDTDVGEWTGRSWKKLSRSTQWKILQKTPSRFQFPGGETFLQIQMRVVAVLDAIATVYKKEVVAVVFHADPIKLASAHYLGLPLDQFQRLTSQPGSVTIFQLNGLNSKLLALNLVPPCSFPKI